MKKLLLIICLFSAFTSLATITNTTCASAITIIPTIDCSSPIVGDIGMSSGSQVWYKFVATSANTKVRVKVSAFDFEYSMISACGNSIQVAQYINRIELFYTNLIYYNNLVVGNTYYFSVKNLTTSTYQDNVEVCVSPWSAPSNDNSNSATQITQSSICSSVDGTQEMATQEKYQQDVWYKFTAVDPQLRVTLYNFNQSLFVKLFSSSDLNTDLKTSDFMSTYYKELEYANLTVGDEYYLCVYNTAALTKLEAIFKLCVTIPPPNDLCANAISIPHSTTCSEVTVNYHSASKQETFGDVWYSFVATDTKALITADGIVENSAIPVKIGLYTGCNSVQKISSVDYNAYGKEFLPYYNLTIGDTYYINIGYTDFISYSYFPFTLCLQSEIVLPPVNDTCLKAIPVSVNTNGNCTMIQGSLEEATNQFGYDDVFYKFIAPSSNFYIKADANFDIMTKVHGSCLSTYITGADFSSTGRETVLVSKTTVTQGAEYILSFSNMDSTKNINPNFSFCIEEVPDVVNDFCTGAINIVSEANGTTFTDATIEYATPTGIQDVWFKFQAVSFLTDVFVDATFDAVIEYYDACGNPVKKWSNSTSSGLETLNLTQLVAGQTYYIRVFKASIPITDNNTFKILIKGYAGNDNAVDAVVMNDNLCSPTSGTLAGATYQRQLADVWYKFVATSTSALIKVNSEFDAHVYLYTSMVYQPYLYSINNNQANSGVETLVATNLTIGSTYHVAVSYSMAKYSFTIPSTPGFTICIEPYSPPINDESVNAITLTDASCNVISGNFTGSSFQKYHGDVWYKFVASAPVVDITLEAPYNTMLYLLTSNVNSLPITSMNSNSGSGIETISTTNLAVGSTYYLAVSFDNTNYGLNYPAQNFTICAQSDLTSSISNSTFEKFVQIYPNPSNGILSIDGAMEYFQMVTIESILGDKVATYTLQSNSESIDLGQLPQGVYFVTFINDNVTYSTKIIYQK